MNIFEHHLSEIRKIILSERDSKLKDIENLKGVSLEIPNNLISIYHVILPWYLVKKIK